VSKTSVIAIRSKGAAASTAAVVMVDRTYTTTGKRRASRPGPEVCGGDEGVRLGRTRRRHVVDDDDHVRLDR